MTSNKQPPSEPKDGFDFIEYPCDYSFKAMCRVQEGVDTSVMVLALIKQITTAESVLALKTNSSRTGKFESVTAVVRLNSRQELESIYALIAASPNVVMTL